MLEKPLHLIATEVCPYAQRAFLMLLYKNIDFSFEFINLKNPPERFLGLSPLKQVPVLITEQGVLFESMVIVEYLDALINPSLLPVHSYQQAWLRAWSAFSGDLLYKQYQWIMEKDADLLESKSVVLEHALQRFLENLPYIDLYLTGHKMTVLDIACAPLWLRFAVIKDACQVDMLEKFKNLSTVWQHLATLPMIEKVLEMGFAKAFFAYLQAEKSALVTAAV